MTDPLYYDDLEIGRAYASDEIEVTLEEIVEFALRYDPQPFHVDAEAAGGSVFGRLVASGWHTAALTMRLRVTGELRLAGGWVGMGVEKLQWPNPVLPGDFLHATTRVLEKRRSKSNPLRGVIRVETQTKNQRREVVFETISAQLVETRVRE